MKIYIEGQELEFENDIRKIDNILSKIDHLIKKTCKIISHMVIDNIEVYGDYYDYFLDNIRMIEKVSVVTLTYKELVYNTLSSTLDYINNSKHNVERLVNNFYRGTHGENWYILNDFLGGISWIISTFDIIDKDVRLKDIVLSYEEWNFYAEDISGLKAILIDFEEALLNNDNVGIADIISYEISPRFNNMEEKIAYLIKIY